LLLEFTTKRQYLVERLYKSFSSKDQLLVHLRGARKLKKRKKKKKNGKDVKRSRKHKNQLQKKQRVSSTSLPLNLINSKFIIILKVGACLTEKRHGKEHSHLNPY
jgi:hypothetical protein